MIKQARDETGKSEKKNSNWLQKTLSMVGEKKLSWGEEIARSM